MSDHDPIIWNHKAGERPSGYWPRRVCDPDPDGSWDYVERPATPTKGDRILVQADGCEPRLLEVVDVTEGEEGVTVLHVQSIERPADHPSG